MFRLRLLPRRPPARSVAAVAQAHRNSLIRSKPIFAVWVGTSDAVTPIFEADGIPSYETESDAVQGFMHLVHYREALDALMATPPSLPQDFAGRRRGARDVVANAVAAWTNLARSDRDDAAARGLFHSDRTRAARPQCR